MTPQQIANLVNQGAEHEVRIRLKKLSLKDRLPKLWDIAPFVNSTPRTLKFFRENFSQELGAVMMAQGDFEKAERLYRQSKNG